MNMDIFRGFATPPGGMHRQPKCEVISAWALRRLAALIVLALSGTGLAQTHPALVDPDATAETRALFLALRNQMGAGICVGHQNATLSGVDWDVFEDGTTNKCDIEAACGVYPAVYGWDLNTVWHPQVSPEIRDQRMGRLREHIVAAFNRGGINTLSWHMWNPVTHDSAYDTTPAIQKILPDGTLHYKYKVTLDRLAEFLHNLKTENGTSVPLIFRPFHGHNLDVFWWGRPHARQTEYNTLFRFTVTYLRDTHNIHNLLYAISPSGRRFRTEKNYEALSPGTDWVDVYGMMGYVRNTHTVIPALRSVIKLARRDQKIAAYTEGGFPRGLTQAPADYFTAKFLKPIKASIYARRAAYLLFWHNYNAKRHWVPVYGDPQYEDFKAFYHDPLTVFADTLPPTR